MLFHFGIIFYLKHRYLTEVKHSVAYTWLSEILPKKGSKRIAPQHKTVDVLVLSSLFFSLSTTLSYIYIYIKGIKKLKGELLSYKTALNYLNAA